MRLNIAVRKAPLNPKLIGNCTLLSLLVLLLSWGAAAIGVQQETETFFKTTIGLPDGDIQKMNHGQVVTIRYIWTCKISRRPMRRPGFPILTGSPSIVRILTPYRNASPVIAICKSSMFRRFRSRSAGIQAIDTIRPTGWPANAFTRA